MKKYLIYTYLIALILSGIGCKKFLNIIPDNVGTLEYAFRNRNEAENYLFSCYSYMQKLGDVTANPGFLLSSEVIYPINLTSDPINKTGFNIIRGVQNSNAPGLNFWDGEWNGQPLFKGIRLCNTMLENIDQPIDLTPAEKTRWIAEVKFLKAYYHYYLFRMYGPIPLLKVNLAVTSSTEEVRLRRMPVDEVVAYVVSLLDEAVPGLPSTLQNPSTEMGRITKSIALSVKADVLATAASPLFNGNPDYTGFKDKQGTALFPASYNAEKWKLAADACKAAITECELNGSKLYNFAMPGNISKLSDSLKKVLTIQNSVTEKWELNLEVIWALNQTFSYQGFATPRMTALSVNHASSNPSSFSVPISTQELFYTEHGLPINEDKTWDYSGRNTLKVGDQASQFYIKEDYQTIKGHFDREPRFYADIAFDGGVWFGNGQLDQNKAYFVQARGSSSFAGPQDMQNLNVTGYWPKKLVNYLSVYDNGFQPVEFRLPIVRLAGLYLLYAEALNEYSGPVSDVLQYVDRVRTRAGLLGVSESWTKYAKPQSIAKFTTKEGMRGIIHQERRIELCFEAQSGWDLRRWKELQNVLSTPVQGWNIYETEAFNYYKPRTQFLPVFGLRDYLWPLKDIELIVNPNLVQNPNW